ncbi:MAG: hypothetical protein MZV64_64230 [Ignavibacteriales bacterium]|nr:hypothetical protein [Ignavibacteriales bacterium]
MRRRCSTPHAPAPDASSPSCRSPGRWSAPVRPRADRSRPSGPLALAASLLTFAGSSPVLLVRLRRRPPALEFVEQRCRGSGRGLDYHVGVDGISAVPRPARPLS